MHLQCWEWSYVMVEVVLEVLGRLKCHCRKYLDAHPPPPQHIAVLRLSKVDCEAALSLHGDRRCCGGVTCLRISDFLACRLGTFLFWVESKLSNRVSEKLKQRFWNAVLWRFPGVDPAVSKAAVNEHPPATLRPLDRRPCLRTSVRDHRCKLAYN